ncbi:MAG: phage Gp37/Gp68 family protein [candidate division Zixibacteria bacterium]|jgi:protein gp37|nr:phage Gp37/Gp68 family protein [candidate division Zixibacteria bacterium]
MSDHARIEYTWLTWNPVTGCDAVSPGCEHCYAARMAKRLQAMGVAKYKNGFAVTLHPDLLEAPLSWKKPRVVFVNSMSDLFHDQVPTEYIQRIFDVMRRADLHTFQILTKRSKRLKRIASEIDWPPNVWMGVTVERREYVYRIKDLCATGATVKFLSLEPLLGPLSDLDLSGIDWAIVGGESGPGARPIRPEWVRDIRDQCEVQGVHFFFKQWGGVNKKRAGRRLDGRLYEAMPELYVRGEAQGRLL